MSVFFTQGKAQSSSFYNSAISYSIGSSPGGLCIADFNGDGKDDIAVTKHGSINFTYTSYLIIFTNSGNGNFTPTYYHNLGWDLGAICSSDFNNDGKADLAITRHDSSSIVIMINNGSGIFLPVRYIAGVQAFDICSADFNGDGSNDLALTTDDSLVSILINNGLGAFNLPIKYISGRWSMKICSADINGDDKPDLVTTLNYTNNSIGVLINTGTGSFLSPVTYTVGSTPKGICWADLNKDGNIDLAVANYYDNNISILMNSGSGSFNNAVNYSVGYYAGSLCSLDVNGDGNIDLAVPNAGSGNVSILKNTGIGTFSTAINYMTGNFPGQALSGDFNGDGRPDITVLNDGSEDISILLSKAEALNFDGLDDYVEVSTPISLPVGNAPRTIEILVKTAYSGTDANIISYGIDSNNQQFGLSINPNGYIRFVAGNNDLLGTKIVSDNNWHHLAVVYSGNSTGLISLYIDGLLDTSTIKNLNTASIGNLRIGAAIGSPVSEFFNGDIDEIRIWDRALCLPEIQNNMNKELILPQTGLITYYKFSAGFPSTTNTLTTLDDIIGNNQGTLINLALSGSVSNWSSPGAILKGDYALPFVNIPTMSVSVTENPICYGIITGLAVSGSAVSYTWSTGSHMSLINVSPPINTTFSVTGQDGFGCINTKTVNIFVLPNPLLTIISPSTTCENTSYLATVMGADTYTWSSGAYTNSISITPSMTITYSVTGKDLNGCISTQTLVMAASANPTVIIGGTTFACINSSINLTATGAITYTWSTGATTSSINVSPAASAIYTVTGTDLNNCSNTQTVSVTVDNTCADVWPGDANSDGTADNLDVLELGLHFTQTGPARASTSNSWQSYVATNWAGTITSGKNLNHSDCNGDGVIDANDTLAIYLNYGLTHAFKPSQQTSTNEQLTIVPDQPMVNKGQWGTASVYLGSSSNLISTINGLAFTLHFDQSLIEPNTLQIDYPVSFLNTGQNLNFRKQDDANGALYAATTHTNNSNINGYGKIAVIHYQIKSSLVHDTVLAFNLVQATQSSANGSLMPLTSGSASVTAIGATVGINELSSNTMVAIYPNPANQFLVITSTQELQKVELVSVTGQVMLSENVSGNNSLLKLDSMVGGIYLINVYSNGSVIKREKIILQK